MQLLQADEPAAFSVELPHGTSPLVVACDHASRRLPLRLGSLGLSEAELSTHIACDIGAAGVAKRLAAKLDATLILQNYSRLAIDCNRPLVAPDSIAIKSERIRIPGNEALAEDEIAARRVEIFEPYHEQIRRILDERQRSGQPSVLLAMHSFTPVYHAFSRPWHVGLLYRHDTRLAHYLLEGLRSDNALCVGDNEPYRIQDGSDYTLPIHGEARGIPHTGIEIRQDLVGDEAGQEAWAERLAVQLRRILPALITGSGRSNADPGRL